MREAQIIKTSVSAEFDQRGMESRIPGGERTTSQPALLRAEDVSMVADTAASAFPEWSELDPARRRAILLAGADALDAQRQALADAMVEETGATEDWSLLNVDFATAVLRESAAMATMVTGDVIPSRRANTLAMAIRQPAGVVLGIAPWNSPIILGIRAIAAPLACGNTCILKASELCPVTHHMIGDILNAAGLPEGVLQVISNAPLDAKPVTDALIAHPTIRRINFTGSTRVGRLIAEQCARHLKPCVLELGGKSPMIVLADADLDEAVRAAAFGAFMNQGQICMSTERVIVDVSVADVFLEKFITKTRTLSAGKPGSGSVLGSLISPEAAMRVKGLVDDAVAKGAQIRVGGQIDGAVMEATILDGVTSSMNIYKEESFGPVVSVLRSHSVDEAVSIANDTEYGLAAAVFGRDIQNAMKVARRIESGICHINGPTVYDEPQMPFGGVKDSGYGRLGGMAGLEEFTELRWVTLHNDPLDYPI